MKNYITDLLCKHLELKQEQIYQLLEIPPNRDLGDIAFPCFSLAKEYRKSPQLIAAELGEQIDDKQVRVEVVGAYLNFFFKRAVYAEQLLAAALFSEHVYGENEQGKGKTVIIDYSSPNIAKPFSLPHLRSTMIGNAIKNLYQACAYKTVGINHIGDWGTQFGKEIVAYKKWGNEEAIRANPIQELVNLYVKFHEEVENKPELDEEARVWFRRLEEGDAEAVRLWEWFVEESLKEFNKIYDLLGVKFDYYMGESFYNDKMDRVIDELTEKGLLEESDGAQIVDLGEEMPPVIIRKKDGSSIYATRDLAAALYRKDRFDFDKAFYVVGNEQKLHFAQVFAVLKKMGYEWSEQMVHVSFGLMLFDNRKMSTREGTVVLLEEVLQKSIELADQIIEEKNPLLENRKAVAEAVGVGAVVFNDLKNNRLHEVNFSWEEALNFEGETGPYIQYVYARIQSLLRRSEVTEQDMETIEGEYLESTASWELIYLLGQYPEVIERAAARLEPSVLSRYLLDISAVFNQFYHQERVLTENLAERNAKIALAKLTANVIRHGLGILGIKSPETI